MRLFLTGATGYVGGAIARAFRDAGHDVTALVRSDASARTVRRAGLTPVPGDLRDPNRWAAATAGHDAIVHAAFDYAPDTGAERGAVDERAVEALLRAAAGLRAHLVYTSNAYLLHDLGPGVVDESVVPPVERPGAWRFGVERRVLDAREDGLATAVVRPGFVYGGPPGGTMPDLFATAARSGGVRHAGAGTARWSLVHLRDLAALYLAIAERRATGVHHAVDGTPLPVARVLDVVNRVAGGSPTGGGALPAGEHTRELMAMDVAVVATRSREIGWRPHYPSFEDGAASALADWRASAGVGNSSSPNASRDDE